jgi:hypothetical protein
MDPALIADVIVLSSILYMIYFCAANVSVSAMNCRHRQRTGLLLGQLLRRKGSRLNVQARAKEQEHVQPNDMKPLLRVVD